MGKRICETKGCINFKQHVGNPNGRHSAIQIQYECLGTIRHVSGTKSIPEVKEYRHFPKTGISFFLSS
ncbi:Uncharacterised protein [Klebsiella pneumoniae]|nr:Uncharacterised protein [Klebsiella pneumoniae]